MVPDIFQTKHLVVHARFDGEISSHVSADMDFLLTTYNISLLLFSTTNPGQKQFLVWAGTWIHKCHRCVVPPGRKWVRLSWSGSAWSVRNSELCSVCNQLHAFDLVHPHRKIRKNKSSAPKSQKAYQMCYRANKIWSPILPSAGLHILMTPIGFRETGLNCLKTTSGVDFETCW